MSSPGSWSKIDLATVSPPKPESKIPMGASRVVEVTATSYEFRVARPISDLDPYPCYTCLASVAGEEV